MTSSSVSKRRRRDASRLSVSFLAAQALILPCFATIQDMSRMAQMLSVESTDLRNRASSTVPLVIENNCDETVWPAIASQAGTGPSSSGFLLSSGDTRSQTVSADWQGRVWARTNCSFNSAGTGPANANGGKACGTGDCNGVLNCVVTGDTPVTLFEALFQGGVNGKQDYIDISLVDGYNLPIGLTYLPGNNSALQDIPPNLTNVQCIGTAGWLSDSDSTTNSTYPLPYNMKTTNSDLAGWCPWNLQVNAPTKPGDGVYPYPDDNIQRPVFDPCNSACAASNAPADCCTGNYDSSSSCKPSLYSTQAKSVCPDAYSYAFDDSTSTFILPTGGGWRVTFCPAGRSTNILKTFGTQLAQLASTGVVTNQILADAQNVTLVLRGDAGLEERRKLGSLGAMVVLIAWLCLL